MVYRCNNLLHFGFLFNRIAQQIPPTSNVLRAFESRLDNLVNIEIIGVHRERKNIHYVIRHFTLEVVS